MFTMGLTADQCLAVYGALTIILDDDALSGSLYAEAYDQLMGLKEQIENKFSDFVLKDQLSKAGKRA